MAAIEAVYAQLEAACSRTSLTEILGSPDVGLASEDVRSECVMWIHRIRSDVTQLATPLHPLPDHEVAVTQYW
ncbi:MAG: hypothetical protein OXQ28_10760, partial [Acidobacteriota bacterium]|nr:hypothetical protein [Acidobacteriota bacterium]